jgi:hypothetical protein
MKLFLTLKHWQLFLVLCGLPFFFEFIVISLAISHRDPAFYLSLYSLVAIFSIALFLTWFYSLGTNLAKKLPITVNMNVTRFKIFLFIPVIYGILSLLVFIRLVSAIDTGAQPNPALFLLIFPIHLFCMFCVFYCLYFVAKTLKTIEWQRPVTFSDYAGEFFLIWFFPIGIWFLQPRINKLFNGTGTSPDEASDSIFAN